MFLEDYILEHPELELIEPRFDLTQFYGLNLSNNLIYPNSVHPP